MTALQILELATAILIALCILLALALLLSLAGFQPLHLWRASRARRSPSSIDPTSSPQLALVEAPSSATDNPAVAEPRELAVTPPLPSRMHVALDPRQTQAIAPGAEW